MSDQSRSEPGFLKGVSKIFRHDETPTETAAPGAPGPGALRSSTADLESRLNALAEKLEERRRARERQEAIASGRIDLMADETERAGVKEARIEKVHGRIREEVLEWHGRLGTRIGPVELDELHAFMNQMSAVVELKAGHTLDDRIRGAIVRRLFEATGERAWSDLLQRMDAAGERWPASDDRTVAAETRAAAELFLQSGIRQITDLVIGVVRVWKDHYPAPESNLRKAVCLRAVAAGLRAALLREATNLVKRDAADLRREAQRLLADEVEAVQSVLDAGVQSIEQADQVMSGASELLEHVLPELCLDRIRQLIAPPKVDAEPAGA